jgi:hypothetical protein
MKRLLAWLAASAASLLLQTALASDESLGVLSDSPAAEKIAASVRAALPDKWESVKKVDFDAAFKAARKERPPFGMPLAAALKNAKLREKALARLRLALTNTSTKAALFITIVKPGKKGLLRLYLVSVSNDEPLVDQDVSLDGESSPPDLVLASIKETLEKWATPPVVEKPKVVERPAAPPKPAPRVEPWPHKGEIEHAMGIVEVGLEIGGRSLAYANPSTTNLRPYSLFGTVAPAIDAEFYPGARSGIPFLEDLGIVGGFRTAVGLKSRTPDGIEVNTSWNRLDAALRYRWRLGKGRKPQVGIRFGVARENFTFTTTATDYPSASYVVLRPAVDVWVPFGVVGLFGEFAAMPTLSSGDTAGRFRDASVFGIEGKGGLAVTPNDWLLIRSYFSYERFGYSMAPQAGDAFAATGAGDAFIRIHVGAGAHF